MMEAEIVIDALLDQHERWEEPTLMQIEDVILDLRKQLSERMAEVVLQGQENMQLYKLGRPETFGQMIWAEASGGTGSTPPIQR